MGRHYCLIAIFFNGFFFRFLFFFFLDRILGKYVICGWQSRFMVSYLWRFDV